MYLQFCLLVSALSIVDVLCQDVSCTSANSLLGGRRRVVSAVFRASNARSGYPASETRLNDDGWCSGLLATDIFDPYIEVDFGRDLILTSVTTEGVLSSPTEILTFIGNRIIERYRVEVAGEDGNLRYITLSANNSQPAIFPLGRSRISNANRHTESLPRPVIGQILRINPYEWNRDDHVCTKLEVYGCPLQECQSESPLHNNPGVDSVIVGGSSIDYNNLFNFDDTGRYYCGPTTRPFTMTITYSSPVLLREIGIHGYNQFPATSRFDDYVTSFSLSFSEDGDNFTEYIRDTGSAEFTVPNEIQHYFGLWPPITASSIKITINDWNDRPCMSLLMLGCNYSNVVDHGINVTNGTAAGTDSGLLDDMTVTLTTTEFLTTTTESVTVTATVTLQTATVTVTADSAHTPSPSPTQSSSDTAASTSCSSDTDNTPIYVAVAIVIVGLLITITVVIVGVLLCRRYQKDKKSAQSVNVKYKTANSANSTGVSIVEVDNDLYGKEVLQPRSRSTSPEDDESAQIALYNSVKVEPDVTETADNPQYGDTMKQSDTTANPKSNENVYSYAIP